MTAFSDIYRRHWADVLRFSLYLCGNHAEAEDLTSEAFLRAWTSTTPVLAGTVRAYLFAIVRNLCRDRWRRRTANEPLNDSLPAPSPCPHAAAEIRSELDCTLTALQRLPEPDREILAMALLMPYEQIAAATGLSVSAIKVRIHRARIRLHSALEATP